MLIAPRPKFISSRSLRRSHRHPGAGRDPVKPRHREFDRASRVETQLLCRTNSRHLLLAHFIAFSAQQIESDEVRGS